MIGQTISHYEILAKLGEGGMGVVYKARDTKLNRLVALKFLPRRLDSSQEDLIRFQQEARSISALNHPAIATIHDVDETEGQSFLVLEYLGGGTLKAKVKALKADNRQLPVRDILEYGIQIAEALAHAHRHHIIHRDVKTDNVMLTEEGKVKLTDFGLAKLKGSAQITRDGSTLGTVAYMAPEQIRGEETDERSDLFALGVVLYELTTTHTPFRGEHEAALTYSIVNESPIPLRSLRPDAPLELERIINRCLDKNPGERYQHAEEIVAALKGISGTAPIISQRAGRSRLPWIAAGTLFILAAAVTIFFLSSKKDNAGEAKTIAVLPFSNMSGSTEDEYFSDGITEDILTQLSKIADLNVISRTSVMQYKGTKKTVREIGKELNAGFILEGSVRRSGNQVRIVAQLIDAVHDKHLWADTYDKEMTKIFAIQSEVAQKIVNALQARLQPVEKARIEKIQTANPEAYNSYLKGREYYYRYRRDQNEIAIALFKRAIGLDPVYAQAWAGLSDAYAQQAGRYGLSRAWLDSSIAAGERAVNLDSTSAEGYKALGTAYFYSGVTDKSIANTLKAASLQPNYYAAIANVGVFYGERGDAAKALPWLKKAVQIDPRSAAGYARLGDIYRDIGAYERSERYVQSAIALEPDNPDIVSSLAFTYLCENKDEQANASMRKLADANPNDMLALTYAGIVAELTREMTLAKTYFAKVLAQDPALEAESALMSAAEMGTILVAEGKTRDSRDLLQRARVKLEKRIESGDRRYDPRYFLAVIHAAEGNSKEATDWLQKAIAAGWRDYALTTRDLWVENLRHDADFNRVMADFKGQVEKLRQEIDAVDHD